MRLIGTLLIIFLFGKLINCSYNNVQNKKVLIDNAMNNQISLQSQIGSERKRHSPNSYGNHYADATSPNLYIHSVNLPSKGYAHPKNPNTLVGHLRIQPMFAPFGTNQPDSSPTTSFIKFIRPDKDLRTYQVSSRPFRLTDRLKNLMNSIFWKDNSSPSKYATSGSSYSFVLKHPSQSSYQNQFNQALSSNYINLLQTSQYKPTKFSKYVQSSANNSNLNKYKNLFVAKYGSSSSQYLKDNERQPNHGMNNALVIQPHKISDSHSTSGHLNIDLNKDGPRPSQRTNIASYNYRGLSNVNKNQYLTNGK